MPNPMQRAASPAGRGSRNLQRAADRQQELTAPSLFDDALDEGRRLRDEGMADALHASDVRWKAAAHTALADLAACGVEFTAEDLRARVGVIAASPNALGALISGAARRGEIVHVGYRQAQRREAHGRDLKTWRGAS
jgi:hypothetical protein